MGDVVPADCVQIIHRRVQANRPGNIRRAGLEPVRRFFEAALLEFDIENHLPAALISRHFFQQLLPPIKDTDAGRAAHLVAGKREEVAADLLHVHRAMPDALGGVNQRDYAPAARALSGPEAFKQPATDALVAALSGPAAREAALSLGVLARNKEVRFPSVTWAALGSTLHRNDARAAAAYALSRLPRGELGSEGLRAALRDPDPWTRSLAARAWGRQGLPAETLRELAPLLAARPEPGWPTWAHELDRKVRTRAQEYEAALAAPRTG